MIKLKDGRAELYQWDTNRYVTVDAECSEVHFAVNHYGRSIDVEVIDGAARIPDTLLQSCNNLQVWAFVGTPDNGFTKISKVFPVNPRNKPADYIFTPTEQTTLEDIKQELEEIKASQDPDAIKNAVEDYLEQNPVDAPVTSVNGKQGAVELNAEDVGAVSKSELQDVANDILSQAKESGEFDGSDGITPHIGANGNWYLGETDTGVKAEGTDGKDGKDGQNGVTPNIQIGEVETLDAGADATASITGTAENPLLNLGIPRGEDGKDDTGGGGSGGVDDYELVATITLEQNVAAVTIDKDDNGNPLSLNEAVIMFDNPAATGRQDCYSTINGEKGSTNQVAIGSLCNTNQITKAWINIYRVGGMLSCRYTSGTPTHYTGSMGAWAQFFDIGRVTKIWLRTSGAAYFMAGAVIKVYARGGKQ